MPEPVPVEHVSIGRRIDGFAVAKPEAARVVSWVFGLLAVLATVRLVAAIAAGSLGIAALQSLAALGSGARWSAMHRARR